MPVMEFQIIDADYTLDNGKPVVRLFGRDPDGQSVCCFVPDFEPYFHVQAASIEGLIENLRDIPEIRRTEIVEKYEPIGYQEHPTTMLKVVVGKPKDVPAIRDEVKGYADQMYETDIMFKNRFMIDQGISGMGWVSASDKVDAPQPAVSSDVVVTSQVSPVEIAPNAPLRYLAFDIECLVDGGMPTPDHSPIIMISLAFRPDYTGETLVLVAKKADGNGADGDGIESFDDEAGMLNRFFEIVRDYDPDVILGYNSNEFDFPYITKRVEVLEARGEKLRADIGRDDRAVFCRKIGNTTRVNVTGRIVADVLPLIRREYSIKQYTLKNVAQTLLDIEKFDVSVRQMAEYWNDDGEKLAEFIEYARRDAVLALRLLLDLRLLDKYVALAQVSGALFQDVLYGGQSSMVENLLLREFGKRNRVIPPKPVHEGRYNAPDELKGGAVLEPVRGLQKDAVVLDYKSLYPTIMMAHNLCYSTVITGNNTNTNAGSDSDSDSKTRVQGTIRAPSGGEFVPAEVYQGIVPGILEDLLDRRTETKKLMRSADGDEYVVLNATQNALKILLNSFYGYSGYARARLYSLVLANAVTSFGRKNIIDTKDLIDKTIKTVRLPDGHEFALSVIYGDTDSVFVRITSQNGEISLDDAESIGKMVAAMVSEKLPDPMELEFESIARRAIFIAKKRYALWVFEKTGAGDGWKDSIKVKGMETVRRDWCGLTSKTLNKVLELVLKDGRVEESVEYVRGVVDRVRNLDVRTDSGIMDELILTRKYNKKEESYKSKQPHITVVEKIRQRGGAVPSIGDRVPFVIVAGKGQFVDSAEDPEYVREHNLSLDVDYYIKKQIWPPVERILREFGVDYGTLNDGSRQKGLYGFGIGTAGVAHVPRKKEVKAVSRQKTLFDF